MSSALVLGQRALREGWRTPEALLPTLFIPLFFLVVNTGQAAEIFPSESTDFLKGQGYAAFQLPDGMTVGGKDAHDLYLTITTSFDRSTSTTVQVAPSPARGTRPDAHGRPTSDRSGPGSWASDQSRPARMSERVSHHGAAEPLHPPRHPYPHVGAGPRSRP